MACVAYTGNITLGGYLDIRRNSQNIYSTMYPQIYIYRRTGNVCERLIIANCEFFPDSQSLERKKLLLPGTTCT